MVNLFKNEKLGICLLILVNVSLFQYIVTIRNDFVWDADTHIRNNPSITDFKYLPSYFKEDSYHTDGGEDSLPILKCYRPLLKVFYLLEYKMFGKEPYGYNAVNIVFNIAVVILCFLLILDITQDLRLAFIASLFYAVNPSRVEAVSWAYSVSNILLALLSLLSLFLYHKKRYVLALLFFSIAMLVRESAVLVPIILILYELLIRRERSWRAYTKIGYYFIIIGVYLTVRHMVLGFTPFTHLKLSVLLNTSAVILKRYVKIFFIPDAAVAMYPLRLFDHLTGEVIVSYLVLAILLGLGIMIARKYRDYLFWYLWFFLLIALSFNVGIAGGFLMTEKELYLASLGFCVLIAKAICSLPLKKVVSICIITICLIVHFAITFQRTLYWKDTITFLEKLIEFTPDFYLPHYDLGIFYMNKKEYQKALWAYNKSLVCAPLSMASYNNIGHIYYTQGQIERALLAWQKARQLDPKHPLPHYNLGLAWEKKGNWQEALNCYNEYLYLSSKPTTARLAHIQMFKEKMKFKK